MLPPAPPLFSTTKGWPKASCSLGATRRASTSLVLPTIGTMIRTGLLGFQSAAACSAMAGAAAATAITAAANFIVKVIFVSLVRRAWSEADDGLVRGVGEMLGGPLERALFLGQQHTRRAHALLA